MTETVSISHAIRRAHLVLAPLIIFPVLIILSMFIAARLAVDQKTMVLTFVTGCLITMAVGLIYNKVVLARWQVWAYTHVENVHELKKAAEIAGLVNSFIGLKDIAKRHPDVYSTVMQRLNAPYEPIDDMTVPYETPVHYRKLYRQTLMIVIVPLFVFAIICGILFPSGPGLLFLLIPSALLLWRYLATRDKQPQFILNEQGIDRKGEFAPWQDITNEEVVRVAVGKSHSYYFHFTTPGGIQKIKIDDLAIKPIVLNHLLFVYRDRHTIKSWPGRRR